MLGTAVYVGSWAGSLKRKECVRCGDRPEAGVHGGHLGCLISHVLDSFVLGASGRSRDTVWKLELLGVTQSPRLFRTRDSSILVSS